MLRYIDGFDHESTENNNITLVYKGPSGAVADSAYFLGYALYTDPTSPYGYGRSLCIYSNYPTGLIKKFDNQDTWLVGFHFRFQDDVNNTFLVLSDESVVQITLYYNAASNKFEVYRGDLTYLLGSSSSTFVDDIFYWIELKVKINSSIGTVELRVNGTVEIALTAGNQNTQAGANAYANRITFQNSAGTATYFDNLYIADGQAGQNDFIGECRIVTLYPDGDDSVTWDKSAGATNASCVDEPQVNTTDYVSTGVPSEVDKYTLGALGITGEIKGAQVCVVAKKDDAGAHTIRTTLRTGGVDYNGNAQVLDASYRTFTKLHPQNPGTLAAWEIAEIDAAIIGQELVS